MVPWPIALLAGLYAAIGTSSTASLAKAGAPFSIWPWVWSAASWTLVAGLVLMRPWARKLAIWVSIFMLASSLAAAWIAAARTWEPGWSLAATGVAGLQCLIIRYLTRPRVKTWFRKEPDGTYLLR